MIAREIIFAVLGLGVVIAWSMPRTYDYNTELKNINYQLSRIADALNKMEVDNEQND